MKKKKKKKQKKAGRNRSVSPVDQSRTPSVSPKRVSITKDIRSKEKSEELSYSSSKDSKAEKLKKSSITEKSVLNSDSEMSDYEIRKSESKKAGKEKNSKKSKKKSDDTKVHSPLRRSRSLSMSPEVRDPYLSPKEARRSKRRSRSMSPQQTKRSKRRSRSISPLETKRSKRRSRSASPLVIERSKRRSRTASPVDNKRSERKSKSASPVEIKRSKRRTKASSPVGTKRSERRSRSASPLDTKRSKRRSKASSPVETKRSERKSRSASPVDSKLSERRSRSASPKERSNRRSISDSPQEKRRSKRITAAKDRSKSPIRSKRKQKVEEEKVKTPKRKRDKSTDSNDSRSKGDSSSSESSEKQSTKSKRLKRRKQPKATSAERRSKKSAELDMDVSPDWKSKKNRSESMSPTRFESTETSKTRRGRKCESSPVYKEKKKGSPVRMDTKGTKDSKKKSGYEKSSSTQRERSRSRSASPIPREKSQSPKRMKKKAKKKNKKKLRSLSKERSASLSPLPRKSRKENWSPEVQGARADDDKRWSSESPDPIRRSRSLSPIVAKSSKVKSPKKSKHESASPKRKSSFSPLRSRSKSPREKHSVDGKKEIPEKVASEEIQGRTRASRKNRMESNVTIGETSDKEKEGLKRDKEKEELKRDDEKEELKRDNEKESLKEDPSNTSSGKKDEKPASESPVSESGDTPPGESKEKKTKRRPWRKKKKDVESSSTDVSGKTSQSEGGKKITSHGHPDFRVSQVIDMDLCDSDSNLSSKIENFSADKKSSQSLVRKSIPEGNESKDNLEVQDMDISQDNDEREVCDNFQLEDMDISPCREEESDLMSKVVKSQEKEEEPQNVASYAEKSNEEDQLNLSATEESAARKDAKKSAKPSDEMESKVQRELRKLNIDMVKTAYDFDEKEQPRRRSRRSRSNVSAEDEESPVVEKVKEKETSLSKEGQKSGEKVKETKATKRSSRRLSAQKSQSEETNSVNIDLASIMLPGECLPAKTKDKAEEKNKTAEVSLSEITLPDEKPKENAENQSSENDGKEEVSKETSAVKEISVQENITETPSVSTPTNSKGSRLAENSQKSSSVLTPNNSVGSRLTESQKSPSVSTPTDSKGSRLPVKFSLFKSATPLSKGKWEDEPEGKVSMSQLHMFAPGKESDDLKAKMKESPRDFSYVSVDSDSEISFKVKIPKSTENEAHSVDNTKGQDKLDQSSLEEGSGKLVSAFDTDGKSVLPMGFSWKNSGEEDSGKASEDKTMKADVKLPAETEKKESEVITEDKINSDDDMDISSGGGDSPDIETVEMDDSDLKREEVAEDPPPPPPPPPAKDVHTAIPQPPAPPHPATPKVAADFSMHEIPIPPPPQQPVVDMAPIATLPVAVPKPVPPPATNLPPLQPEQLKQMEDIKNYYNRMLEQVKSKANKAGPVEDTDDRKMGEKSDKLQSIPLPSEKVVDIPLPSSNTADHIPLPSSSIAEHKLPHSSTDAEQKVASVVQPTAQTVLEHKASDIVPSVNIPLPGEMDSVPVKPSFIPLPGDVEAKGSVKTSEENISASKSEKRDGKNVHVEVPNITRKAVADTTSTEETLQVESVVKDSVDKKSDVDQELSKINLPGEVLPESVKQTTVLEDLNSKKSDLNEKALSAEKSFTEKEISSPASMPKKSAFEKSPVVEKDSKKRGFKKSLIKIGPISMSTTKEMDSTAKMSSEEGELKSESEADDSAKSTGKSPAKKAASRWSEESKDEEKISSTGFGIIPKSSKQDAGYKSDSAKQDSQHSIQSSAVSSMTSDIEYDKKVDEFLRRTEGNKESSYEQKVDEFLKKVDTSKPKSTVERKFDEFLEKVRKPKAERKFEEYVDKSKKDKDKLLEQKVDEFLEKTRRKESKYDEYRSKYEREEFEERRNKYEKEDWEEKRRSSKDDWEERREERGKDRYRRRERDPDERHYGRRDRDRSRERERSRERDRSSERSRDRRRSRSWSRDRYRGRSRSRSRERRDRHKSRHSRREDRRRDNSSSDDERSHRSSRRRSDRDSAGGSKEKDRDRDAYQEEKLTDEWLKYEKDAKNLTSNTSIVSSVPQATYPQTMVAPQTVVAPSQEYYVDAYGNYVPTNQNVNNSAEAYPGYPYVACAGAQPQDTPQYVNQTVQPLGTVQPQISSQPQFPPQQPVHAQYVPQPGFPPPQVPQYQQPVQQQQLMQPQQPMPPQQQIPQPVYGPQGQVMQTPGIYGVEQPQIVPQPFPGVPQGMVPTQVVAPQPPQPVPVQQNLQMAPGAPVVIGPDGRPIPQFQNAQQIPIEAVQQPPDQSQISQAQPVVSGYGKTAPAKRSLLPFPFPTQKSAQPAQPIHMDKQPTNASHQHVSEEARSGTPVPGDSPNSPRDNPMGVGSFLTQLFTEPSKSDSPSESQDDGGDENSQSSSDVVEKSNEQASSDVNFSMGRMLPIKLGIKQDFQSGKEFESTAAQSSPVQPKEGKPEKVKSRWRRFSELDLGSPNSMMSPTQDSNVPSSTVADISSSESGTAQDSVPMKWKKSMAYDAWDPASDLMLSPTAGKSSKKEKEGLLSSKKEKREKGSVQNSDVTSQTPEKKNSSQENKENADDPTKPPYFDDIEENIYLNERKKGRKMKEVRRMLCDCTTSKEDRDMGVEACGEDCLNRMLYIECGSRCPCGEFCTNKRFQKREYAKVEAFQTDWKGFGLRATADLEVGDFVMEYIGEVLDYKQFKARTKQQAKLGQEHHYFMALNSDEVIDASYKGNASRFMNHSCDPNCETQKWTVNGVLRVGFFVRKPVKAMTELTFDYQFERYGKEAQKCFCGASNCRGTIGGSKMTPLKSNRKTDVEKKKITELFEDEVVEEQLEEMNTLENGLRNKEDVLNLCRLMVRIESLENRLSALSVLEKTSESNCLRLFLDYHGLDLLWTWLTDTREESIPVKEQIMNTLKRLPVPNKNILQDSKILSLVQRLAGKDDNDENSGGGAVPPPPPSRDKPQSILSSSNKDRPVKKRVKFADDASSSDNESRSSITEGGTESSELGTESESVTFSKTKENRKGDGVSDLCRQVLDKGESSQISSDNSCAADSTNKESESTNMFLSEIQADSTYDSDSKNTDEEKICDSSQSKGQLGDLAESLLEQWKDLKELFRIPKKEQVEERKRIEKALDEQPNKQIDRYEMIQDKSKQREAGWVTKSRKKKRPPPPPPSSSQDEDRKTLLPTPPKMSKEERRQLFEAQVKAQDEMQAERMRKQYEAYAQFYFTYINPDPNNPPPVLDPNNPLIGVDPNVFQQLPPEIQSQILQAHELFGQHPQQVNYPAMGQGQTLPQGSEVTQGMGQGQPAQVMQLQDPSSHSFLQQIANLQQQLEIQNQLSAHVIGGGHQGEEDDPPPPPSPPKPKVEKLPPNWKTAKDSEGKVYYYHTVTRQTQWEPPTWEAGSQDDMDLDSPLYEDIVRTRTSKKQTTTTAAADTSSELAKKIKDQFRSKMSGYVVTYLNPYRKPDCKVGRITSTEDFKHLARKLTHHVMAKELKHCRHVEDLEVNENVKAKAKDYVRKYMSKFGSIYRKTGSPDI
ncbi:hypothetical protein FSP39_021087 [Pinctada imbricata]|uniref:[histone H3]-lysine(36) N-trimethyltransferase n=1 Tax=Pinctada imbricata TaxID=66713 RepID=A0AA88XDK6_PINIB|nr:hypothetical protein FSP39_021087 [Pinctada imbricata]